MAGKRAARVSVSPMPAVDLLLLHLLALIGLVAVWEVYAHPWLVVAVIVALAAASVLAWVVVRRRAALWLRIVLGIGAYLVVGALVSVPTAYTDFSQAPTLLLGVLTAPVTGWKDVLTLDLPLGVYQSTLAPTVLLFTVLPYIALQFAWGSAKRWPIAAPTVLLLTIYGVAFGSSALRNVGGSDVSRQVLVGLAAFIVTLVWLVWRSAAIRRRALVIAAESAVGGVSRRVPVARLVTGFGVVAGATVIGLLAAPTLVTGQAREVLRTGVDPEIVVQQRITPLTTYREFFSDERYDEALIRVDAPQGVSRIKLVTLAAYDGAQMHVVSSSGGHGAASFGDQGARDGRGGAFIRVPAAITQSDALVEMTVTVQEYGDIWVPLGGELHSIDFRGAERTSLADGFFYEEVTGTGVQLAAEGLRPGDTIRETVEVGVGSAIEIESFVPARQGASLNADLVPESLSTWVKAQQVASDGAGLGELIERLRARGMLSHALTIESGESPAWMSDLGDYTFAPSRAGHSTDRIGRLFNELLDREEAAGSDASAEQLVAASGDDEQFAVAAALIADSLGFDARVAVGFRLADVEEGLGVPACVGGECRGAHLSAWLEVRDAATGAWAELVTTPQHEMPLSRDLSQRSDPKNPSSVDEQSAALVPPLEANPSDATEKQEEEERTNAGIAWLWPVLRIGAISLLAILIISSPLFVVLGLKRLRRTARRRLQYPSDSVAAAWEEFVDESIDHGLPVPSTHTRSEIAAMYARDGSHAAWLAQVADHADYSAEGASPETVHPYWEAIGVERAGLRESMKPFARLRAAVSLRSIRYWFTRVKARADILESQ